MPALPKIAFAAALLALPATAHADVLITIEESGADVVATLSGDLDLSGLTFVSSLFFTEPGFRASPGYVGFGTLFNDVTAYSGFTGPLDFGTGFDFVAADAGGGSDFAFNVGSFDVPYVFLSPNYVSGDALSATAVFSGTTLAALGLAPGDIIYASPIDTITISIGGGGGGVIPEPATWAMMIGGIAAAGGALRRRTRTTVRYA